MNPGSTHDEMKTNIELDKETRDEKAPPVDPAGPRHSKSAPASDFKPQTINEGEVDAFRARNAKAEAEVVPGNEESSAPEGDGRPEAPVEPPPVAPVTSQTPPVEIPVGDATSSIPVA